MAVKSVQIARNLRFNNDQLGVKCRRQMPIGRYTVDFCCLERKLIIELDGGQHAESKKDKTRTVFLNSLGFRVIRFWNNEVLENIDGVLEELQRTIAQEPSPSGRGQGEGT